MSRAATALLVAALLGGTAACSSDDDAPPQAAPATAGPTGNGEGTAGGTASGAGVEDLGLDDALVEQELVAVDDPDDAVAVAVLSLEVQGKVMRLDLGITPDRSSVSDGTQQSLFDLRQFFSKPALLDRENLKRYAALQSGFAEPLFGSDAVETRTVNGRPMRATYYFAAPEDDIDAIDVVLSDSYPAFTDVPIAR